MIWPKAFAKQYVNAKDEQKVLTCENKLSV